MTEQEISQLKQAADQAELAAATAEAEAELDPANAAKRAATKVATRRAEDAKKSWRIAAFPPVSPTDWRVILLGVYLAVTMFGSVYLLAMLTMAEPPDKAPKDLRTACCGAQNEDCSTPPASPTPAPSPSASDGTTAVDPAPVSGTTGSGNDNQNETGTPNTPIAGNLTANNSVTANSNKAAARTKPSGNAANKTSAANTDTGWRQELIEPTIPAIVCATYFNRLPADGYLFLVVLFAGIVGAVARGIFSFVRHQGENDFSFSWTWFYLFLPFSGAIVSLFLYFIIRGGFYGSPVGKSLVLNLFAFIALGTLSGLFAENAMEKLRQVAEVLLAKVPPKVANAGELKQNDKQP